MNYNAQKLAGEALAAENRLLSRAIGRVNSSDVPGGMHFISFLLNSQRVGRRGVTTFSATVLTKAVGIRRSWSIRSVALHGSYGP
jgi:hypothetical protein